MGFWSLPYSVPANYTTLSQILTIILIIYSSSCKATLLSPSSCGNIQNITCPFTLKGDHQTCDDYQFTYQLSCANNRTSLYTPSHKLYYVEDINYENFTIRIVDPGLEKNNYSSLPFQFFQDQNFYQDEVAEYTDITEHNWPVIWIECPSPVISRRYLNVTSKFSSFSYKVLEKYYSYSYAYVVAGSLNISELEDNCRVSKIAWVSSQWPLTDHLLNKAKPEFSEIHDGMVYGFDVAWEFLHCLKCDKSGASHCFVGYEPRAWICEYSCNFHRLNSYKISLKYDFFLYLFGIPFLLAVLVYRAKRRHLSIYNTIEDFLQAQSNLMPIRYTYTDIKKITYNFRDRLGEGAFGTVYKGKLRSGLSVAVKILAKSKATGQEFINEVATSGRIHHVNVVELVGFCFEGQKRALIYEFMPNGSLEKYLFCKEGTEKEMVSLSWEKMYDISYKIATGIHYLHRGCDMQILHFDIKPHNILLDTNYNPKISDFGLAKLYATGDSIVTLTAARGTMGYMAPEMFYKNVGSISYKADVYSFGMLLMEMAGRRKKSNPFVDHVSQNHFPSWVYEQCTEGKEIEMDGATEEERKLVKKMVIIALWCIQLRPNDRPSMNKVIEMFERDIEFLVAPPNSFFYPQEDPLPAN
ncbi:hypothetical protein DCAR_0310311 [Daucus carota subsp. sativus]|uniref:Protein kinase domain-containing protein n=1 Tax=Daucus carota subsp. sativus TaxID=79200 RepID=A0AAF1AQ44_DAUCS|nr:hypothetical protein DCAR_0310311 [Daucus carota subsp. sativus]